MNYVVQDTSLTAVANAIRTKSGGNSQIIFPTGFANEIGKMCSVDGIANGSQPSGDITINVNSLRDYAFSMNNAITSVTIPNAATISSYAFYNVRTLQSVNAPLCTSIQGSAFQCTARHNVAELNLNLGNVTSISGSAFYMSSINKIDFPYITTVPSSCFRDCNHAKYVNLPKVNRVDTYGLAACQKTEYATADVLSLPSLTNVTGSGAFGWNTSIVKMDFSNGNQITSECFRGNSNMNVLIIRNTTPVPLSNTNGFTDTPFASGGTGGTIYIPEILYNHLGDGTNLDYQSTTNWSALYGYGTITWAKIEGSQYQYHYADGVNPVPQPITNILIQCTSSNTDQTAIYGESYSTTITTINGEKAQYVELIMNGVDVTNSVYNTTTGDISIDSVNGKIEIFASSYSKQDHELPSTYQEVDYIESDGNTLIDTGVVGRDGIKIVAKMGWSVLEQKSLFGCRKTNGDTRLYATYYNSKIDLAYGNDKVSSIIPQVGRIYEITYDLTGSKIDLRIDDTVVTNNTYDTSLGNTGLSIYIFGANYGYSANPMSRSLFSGMTITDANDDLLFDGIPCYRKSDGEIGVYDLVSNTFLTNINSV